MNRRKRTLESRVNTVISRSFFISGILSIVVVLTIILIILCGYYNSFAKSVCNYISLDIVNIKQEPKAIKEWVEGNQIIRSLEGNGNLDFNTENNNYYDSNFNSNSNSNSKYIIISVKIKGKEMYSNINGEDQSNWITPFIPKIIYNKLARKNTEPIKVMGKTVGSVTTKFNIDHFTAFIVYVLLILILVFALLSIFVSAIIGFILSIPIIYPIKNLQTKMMAAANEEFDGIVNEEIILKKPLKEIESIIDSANLIIQKMKNYNKEIKSQYEELEAQNEELVESKIRLVEKERAVSNLMNNAEEGFLYFKDDLIIKDNYSVECEKIFNGEISGKKFSELLYHDNIKEKNFFEEAVKTILQEDEAKQKIFISLLPNELVINQRYIFLKYKVIKCIVELDVNELMVIMSDITENRQLQNKMEEERSTLKMVVKVVADFKDFMECVNEYKEFYQFELYTLLNGKMDFKKVYDEIFRDIHTFKGVFAQFDMQKMVTLLHNIEGRMTELKAKENLEELKEFIVGIDFETTIQEQIGILKEILGEDFFDRNNKLIIDKDKISDVEKKLTAVLTSYECKVILPEISKLKFQPFKELLKSYPDYTLKLAERMGKMIRAFKIEGGDFLADNDKYHKFTKSLVHVFRNAVDHGIEYSDERVANMKSEFGSIKCSIKKTKDNIIIAISDDGNGIDIDKLKLQPSVALVDTEDDVINSIFVSGVTTKDRVTEVSGRGVGLAAVIKELETINGSVVVNTEKNKGTEFIFTIPIKEEYQIKGLSRDILLKSMMNIAERFISSQLKEEPMQILGTSLLKTQQVKLLDYTAFIDINGVVKGKFIISFDRELAYKLMKNFLIDDDILEEEEEKFIEATISECSNIILGNSFRYLKEFSDMVKIEAPGVTMISKGCFISYPIVQLWENEIQYENGKIKVLFICEN